MLTLTAHPGTENWAPPKEVAAALSGAVSGTYEIHLHPRREVAKVWEADHPGKTYDKDPYAFRAYQNGHTAYIFVDETETPESVMWLIGHELAHMNLRQQHPELWELYQRVTPTDYFTSDEAHERDPEEQLANAVGEFFAGDDYPRTWWRKRVSSMTKQASEFQGIPIDIERQAGTTRQGVNRMGQEWERKTTHDYGSIPGTYGIDGEPIDVYVGPRKNGALAFVVHQLSPDGTSYDEDKVMLGFRNERQARNAFLKNSIGPQVFGAITPISVRKLRQKAERGDPMVLMNQQAANQIAKKLEKNAMYAGFADELEKLSGLYEKMYPLGTRASRTAIMSKNRALRELHKEKDADMVKRTKASMNMQKLALVWPSFVDEMTKVGATRQLKILRQLVRAGKVRQAEQFANRLHRAGALKVTGPGSQLGYLGGGAEGAAHTVVGAKGIRAATGARVAPEAQVAVRKTFDPKGVLYSKHMLAEKMQAGRALRGDPRFAELLSKRIGRGAQGGRYMHYQRVAGTPIGQAPGGGALGQQVKGMETALQGRGRVLADVAGHPENVLVTRQAAGSGLRAAKGFKSVPVKGLGGASGTAPSGATAAAAQGSRPVAIDYLPMRQAARQQVTSGTAPFQQRLMSQMGARVSPAGKLEAVSPSAPFARASSSRGLKNFFGSRMRAGTFRHAYGGSAAPSQFTPRGPMRASPQRALAGL